jgi:hypothetical protein
MPWKWQASVPPLVSRWGSTGTGMQMGWHRAMVTNHARGLWMSGQPSTARELAWDPCTGNCARIISLGPATLPTTRPTQVP